MTDMTHPFILLAERFIDAIERGDLDALRGTFAPDVRIWHNSDQIFTTREQNDAAAILFFENFSKRAYKVRRYHLLPNGVLLQFVIGLEKPDGRRFDWPGCIVFDIANDRIALLEEYIDVASLMAAMG